MSFDKARHLAALLDQHIPHQRPGFAGHPPVRSAHPLDTLFRRHVINEESYVAGLRFRADWELAEISGEGVTDWDRFYPKAEDDFLDELAWRRTASRPPRRPPSSIPAVRYDAKQTLGRLRVVTGSFGFQLMRGVCVMGISLAHISTALKVHRDYLSLRLREALADAARFYGEIIDRDQAM